MNIIQSKLKLFDKKFSNNHNPEVGCLKYPSLSKTKCSCDSVEFGLWKKEGHLDNCILKSIDNNLLPKLSSKVLPKRIEKLKFSYTSRADMAMDIRDISPIVDKINELVEAINILTNL